MDWVKAALQRVGTLLLSLVRILRKAICCRRRREPEYLLPITISHTGTVLESTQWETWPESPHASMNDRPMRTDVQPEVPTEEDFFKDMVPQIRKPKKVFVQTDSDEPEPPRGISSRLTMDPKAILMDSELGDLEDLSSNTWEDVGEQLDEGLIMEERRKEQERRKAEHQRRKQEREVRRASRSDKSKAS